MHRIYAIDTFLMSVEMKKIAHKGIWHTFSVIDHWNIMTSILSPVRFRLLYLIAF